MDWLTAKNFSKATGKRPSCPRGFSYFLFLRVLWVWTSYGPCPWHWAEAPIQNRRPRRCRNDPEHVSLHPSLPCKTEGGEHGPRSLSRPLVTPQHHIEVVACVLPPVLQWASPKNRMSNAKLCIISRILRGSLLQDWTVVNEANGNTQPLHKILKGGQDEYALLLPKG